MLLKFLSVASIGVTFLTIQAMNNNESSRSLAEKKKAADLEFANSETQNQKQIPLTLELKSKERASKADTPAKIKLPEQKIVKVTPPPKVTKKSETIDKVTIRHSYLPPERNLDQASRSERNSDIYSANKKTAIKRTTKRTSKQTRTARLRAKRELAYKRYRRREAARKRAIRRYYRNMYRYSYGYY